ncbi:MAG: DNA repair protein RecN [Betaproteobacteria bacterium]|nr:DNA repair protein RecN [Burkholderiales bacterium]NBX90734.1 DNA repair protein RecN [Betaproteobacteria bacterium]
MALRNISLRDFVIVRELDLNLATGFSVLTGETGAGKSILIDAVQLALGNRAEASVVREGAVRCEISAEFDCPVQAHALLEEAGFEVSEHLLLRRSVDNQGKSRAWVNGSPATATQLRALGEMLLDIHGQHAWQSLTRPESVRGLLDAYAGVDTAGLRATWLTWRSAQHALSQARLAQDSLGREQERLSWQIGELDKLAPALDEWEGLNSQHTRLSHAQALIDAAQAALSALDAEESGNAGGALAMLWRGIGQLQAQAHVEPEFQALTEVLNSSLAQAQDAAHSLQAYLRKTDLDPARLAQLDQRMAQWMSLARRYKRPPEELAALLAGWRQELSALEVAGNLAALEAAEQAAQQAYLAEAKKLSKLRQKAAPQLAQAVTQAMQQLGMQGGRLEVALQPLEQAAQYGLEDVQFLVAGHAGSSPRPVGKVASGGELSRIALAIAVTTSELGEAGTLIFDEVDAGVGGAVAQTVGRLMQQLGEHRQVLAVTHLPQVASCADHHLWVSKTNSAQGVSSSVSPISGEQRTQEIARMLGGEKLSQTTLAHAREMLGGPEFVPKKKVSSKV